jgi:hypothetical protein
MTAQVAVVGCLMLLVSAIRLIQPLPYALATHKRALLVFIASSVIFGFAVRRSRATTWPLTPALTTFGGRP